MTEHNEHSCNCGSSQENSCDCGGSHGESCGSSGCNCKNEEEKKKLPILTILNMLLR